MTVEDLQGMLHRKPFAPFRLFISDGAIYDVRHPELCVPGRDSLFLGFPDPAAADEPVYKRYAIVDLMHVTRMEPLEAATAPGNGSGSA